jgi:hypothetical protein
MCETNCCCKGGHGHHRRHLTKEEQTERLQKYADDLAKELQAVNERIEELK